MREEFEVEADAVGHIEGQEGFGGGGSQNALRAVWVEMHVEFGSRGYVPVAWRCPAGDDDPVDLSDNTRVALEGFCDGG